MEEDVLKLKNNNSFFCICKIYQNVSLSFSRWLTNWRNNKMSFFRKRNRTQLFSIKCEKQNNLERKAILRLLTNRWTCRMTLLKTTIACLNFPLTLLGGSFTAWSISSLPGLDSTNQYILLVFVCGKTTEYNRVKLETGYPDILPPTVSFLCC